MLTTELSFDGTDPSAVTAVKGQIDAIHSACPKCLLVLALNSTGSAQRMYALQQIFGNSSDPNLKSNPYYNEVSLVGFGIRANDYPTCNPADVIGQNYIFSRDVMRLYSKPTIWLYVGASEGNNSAGTCTWDAQSVNSFYENVFSLQQGMASSGIVGASFYEFIDRSGPLPCASGEGCDFGFLYQNGTEKHPEINAWSYICGVFGSQLNFRPPLIFSRNTFGESCDVQKTDQILDYIPSDFNTNQGLNTDEVAPTPAKKALSCGEACPSYNYTLSGAYTGSGSFDSSNCDKYPLIDQYADDRDVSSTFFKAIVSQTGFDPNYVSCASASAACNPSGLTLSEICSQAGLSCPTQVTCPAGEKVCAYGLAQCTDYPGQYYVENGLGLSSAISGCGGVNYNPFNPAQSACCGLNTLQGDLGKASIFVASHWGQFLACDSGLNDADKLWTTYFIAASYYHGDNVDGYLSGYDCKSGSDFVSYLKGTGNFTYAANVLGAYKSAVSACGSECSA